MSGFPLVVAQVLIAVALVAVGALYVRVFLGRWSATPRRVPLRAHDRAAARSRPVTVRPDIFARDPEQRLEAFRELERLAHRNPAQRQRFVGQVLAQLRFRGWSELPDWHARLWAFVLPHLRPDEPEFWPGIAVRVERTVLHDVDLSGCEIRALAFERVRCTGTTRFTRTVFTGNVTFEDSCFAGHVRFRGAEFRGAVNFGQVTFAGTAAFPGVTVAGSAGFRQARFSGLTDFTGARFAGPFDAVAAGFAGRTSFRDTQFAATAEFAEARFTGHADFTGSSFVDRPGLARAWARTDWYALRSWPPGWSPGAEDITLPKRPGRWAALHDG